MSTPVINPQLLRGRKGLIVGIANDRSIAWGCARAFHAFGAELAVTYLNDKAKPFVEPLAREVEATIFMPLDVTVPGQLEAVFDRIASSWGEFDFVVHSIAFSPRDTLGGRVVDVPREGFLTTMDISCWSFIRMAHLAEPLMKNGGTLFTMTYYGSQMVVENYNVEGGAGMRRALSGGRTRAKGDQGACHLARCAGHACGLGDSGVRRAAGKDQVEVASPRAYRHR
jgi:enoyl-[acyl-carrier protein] reductase I